MPAAFHIAGAARSHYDGTYTRMATATCNGKPVYQLSGSEGYVLFQPTEHSSWLVGSSKHATTCEDAGVIKSSGNGGHCTARPDGSGCAGKWKEFTNDCGGDSWCPSPSLSVAAVDSPSSMSQPPPHSSQSALPATLPITSIAFGVWLSIFLYRRSKVNALREKQRLQQNLLPVVHAQAASERDSRAGAT